MASYRPMISKFPFTPISILIWNVDVDWSPWTRYTSTANIRDQMRQHLKTLHCTCNAYKWSQRSTRTESSTPVTNNKNVVKDVAWRHILVCTYVWYVYVHTSMHTLHSVSVTQVWLVSFPEPLIHSFLSLVSLTMKKMPFATAIDWFTFCGCQLLYS